MTKHISFLGVDRKALDQAIKAWLKEVGPIIILSTSVAYKPLPQRGSSDGGYFLESVWYREDSTGATTE